MTMHSFVQSGGLSPQLRLRPRKAGFSPCPIREKITTEVRSPHPRVRERIVIGAFCLGWLGLPRLVSSDPSGSFFGLDRLSPRRLSPRPPLCWLTSVALSLVPGAWCCVEAVGSSPAEPARPDRTRRTGASADSCPQLALPPELKGQIKATATIYFGCVRVCLWAQSISSNCLNALYITCIPS